MTLANDEPHNPQFRAASGFHSTGVGDQTVITAAVARDQTLTIVPRFEPPPMIQGMRRE